jgi:hypothetical protein
VATTIEYLLMDRAYHLNMSKIYFADPAERMVAADALVREVPEEEDDEEEQGEDEEGEDDDDEGEGYSE